MTIDRWDESLHNLIGNLINHDLDLGWDMAGREVERNHPSKD